MYGKMLFAMKSLLSELLLAVFDVRFCCCVFFLVSFVCVLRVIFLTA